MCRPMTFLTELATNLTRDGIEVILYSGNDDAVVAHFSTEGELICMRERM